MQYVHLDEWGTFIKTDKTVHLDELGAFIKMNKNVHLDEFFLTLLCHLHLNLAVCGIEDFLRKSLCVACGYLP